MTKETAEQVPMFDPDTWSRKMCREPSAQTKERISELSSKKSSKSSTKTPLFLDLRTANGEMSALSWETDSPLLGVYSTLSFGESPSVAAESHLSQILQDATHPKYYLSAKACQGILRRAERRGKILPKELETVLIVQSHNESGGGCEGALDQGAKMNGIAAICIQGNCIDRADTAGCNGKGWRADDISFTLNTIDRHAVYDARVDGDGTTVPTLTGDHENRVTDYTAVVCIGNGQVDGLGMHTKTGALNCMHDQQIVCTLPEKIYSFDRASFNQGINAQFDFEITDEGISPSLIAKGPSAVSGIDCRNIVENPDINGTLQSKPNGGISLNCQNVVRYNSIVRRLTPLECERLQGFPDGWTDIGEWTDAKGKVHKECADTARYKALGNSIALPPWRYVLSGVFKYCGHEKTMASLFDGIGGFPLIWQELGGDTLWASEIEEFPIAVTKKYFN